jgi:hypothetical protein
VFDLHLLSQEDRAGLERAAGIPLEELARVHRLEWMPVPTFTTKLSKQTIKKNKAF